MSQANKLTAEQQRKLDAMEQSAQNIHLGERLADVEEEGTLHVDCSGTGPWNVVVPWDCDLVDAGLICTAAHGGGTLQVNTGATPISDAMVCAVEDTRANAATLDLTYAPLIAAGTVLNVAAANGAEGIVTLKFRRR